jgi:hypothetical protein
MSSDLARLAESKTTEPNEPNVVALNGPRGRVSLVPVRWDGRTVGAFVVSDGRVRFRPVIDADQVISAVTAVAAIAALGASVAAARRRSPAIGAVTMGPGGWVSLKGVSAPSLRPAKTRRPWWARVLRAHRLVIER